MAQVRTPALTAAVPPFCRVSLNSDLEFDPVRFHCTFYDSDGGYKFTQPSLQPSQNPHFFACSFGQIWTALREMGMLFKADKMRLLPGPGMSAGVPSHARAPSFGPITQFTYFLSSKRHDQRDDQYPRRRQSRVVVTVTAARQWTLAFYLNVRVWTLSCWTGFFRKSAIVGKRSLDLLY